MSNQPTSSPQMPARTRGTQVATLAVMGAIAGAVLTPLFRVFSPVALIAPGVFGVLTGLALAYYVATRRLSGILSFSAGLAAAYVGAVVLRIFGTLASGEVLTVSLATETAAGIVRVWKDMLTLEPRFGLDSGMILAPFLIAFLVAFGASLIALRVRNPRRAIWAGVVPLAGYGLSTLLGWRTAFIDGRISVAIVFVLLLWAAWWSGNFQARRVIALTLTAAVVLGAGAIAGPMLVQNGQRYVLRDELAPPFDPRDFPSPLSAYRTYVKDLKESELFTVSGLPAGVPVRLAVMDDFDGVVWNVSGAHDSEGSGAFRRIGDQLQPTERGIEREISFEIHDLPGPWMPTVGWLDELHFTSNIVPGQRGEVRYNDATGTALLPQGMPTGTEYEISALVPSPPKDEDLISAKAGGVSLPAPQNVPDSVVAAASDATREASSPLGMARALEQYLQQQGWFSNGQTTAGDYPSLAGHGASRLISLLTSDLMVGNDEQYASAMALMGRSAGLPTRVVMGFIPDAEDVEDDTILDDVTIRGEDVHAWVEIQFANVGWVPFYPTPPESKTPAEDTPQDTHESQPQNLQPPLPPPDEVTPPENDTERPQTEDTTEDDVETTNYLVWIAIGGGVGLLILLWLLPILVIVALKRARRKRRRRQAHPIDQITGGWDELVDVTFDLTGSAQAAREKVTRSEFAADLATVTATITGPEHAPHLQQEVHGLARGADYAVFGPTGASPHDAKTYWGEVDRVTRSLRRSVSSKRRRKARRTTVSLKYRRAQRRAARKERTK